MPFFILILDTLGAIFHFFEYAKSELNYFVYFDGRYRFIEANEDAVRVSCVMFFHIVE